MKSDYPQPKTSVLVWLIVAIVAGFLLQTIFLRWFGAGREFSSLFALSIGGLHAGKVWTLLTYSFLHDPDNLLHLVGNLIGLYFFGRELLAVMGERRFLTFYGCAVLAGGLLWGGTHWMSSTPIILMGASAGVAGLLVVFACFYPNRQITFLLFFIIPVTLKPKYVAIGLLVLDLFGFVFYEILGAISPFGIAHSAHLGGMLVGWVYYRYVHQGNWRLPKRAVSFELPQWAKKKQPVETTHYEVNISNKGDLRAEVDRILDKINSQGFGALTPEEKRVLDSARDTLSRH